MAMSDPNSSNKVPFEDTDDDDDFNEREVRDRKRHRPKSFKQAERRRRINLYDED